MGADNRFAHYFKIGVRPAICDSQSAANSLPQGFTEESQIAGLTPIVNHAGG
jgi:hypothetical protein